MVRRGMVTSSTGAPRNTHIATAAHPPGRTVDAQVGSGSTPRCTLTPAAAAARCDRLHAACCASDAVQLSQFISLSGACASASGILTLDVDALLPSLSVRAVPVSPVAIATTPSSLITEIGEPVTRPEALAQGTHAMESGYVTLDASRRAVSRRGAELDSKHT